MSELESRPFVCPYHGRIPLEAVTTVKTCGRCMEEMSVHAGAATLLERAPYAGHAPRWKFDCGNCKFAWCCGPRCSCVLRGLKKPPKWRRIEVAKALALWVRKRLLQKRDDV